LRSDAALGAVDVEVEAVLPTAVAGRETSGEGLVVDLLGDDLSRMAALLAQHLFGEVHGAGFHTRGIGESLFSVSGFERACRRDSLLRMNRVK